MRTFLRMLLPSVATLALAWTSNASAQQAPSSPPTPAQTAPVYTTTTPGGATTAVVDPNEPVIDTTTTRTSFVNRPLMVTGLVLFAGAYVPSLVVAATSNREADEKLYYPVVGPWMDLSDRGCDLDNCPNEGLVTAGLIASGAVQGLGALAVLTSLFVPEKTTHRWYLIGSDKVHVAPSNVGRYGYGLSAVGTF